MKLTDRINRVSVSLTIGMAQKARELKAQGKDIISLSLGEPDFDTPEHIKNAAKAAMDAGKTKYTPVSGIPELKDAIIGKMKRDSGVTFSRDNIMVSTGAKHSIMNLMLSLVDHGDEVIIPLPYWVSYSEMVHFAGGKCIFIPSDFEDGFAINIEALKAAVNERSKVLIFSSPNNPAGSVIRKSQLAELAQIAKDNPQLTIISDEIYEDILFEGEHESIIQFEDIRQQVVIINGVSKRFAMTGWRIGFMAGPKEIISACDKLQGQFTSGANSIAQWAATEAFSGDMAPTEHMTKTFKQRRDLLLELLSDIPGFELDTPLGAFYLFPKISSWFGKEINGTKISNSLQFTEVILNEALVSLVPGIAFGMDEHIRISYAASEEQLTEAARRIKALLKHED